MKVSGQLLRREFNPVIAAIVCAVVLVGTLVFMVQQRVAILRDGTEVILKAAPVDPRDLMRGDFVELRYADVSVVDGSLFSAELPEKDTLVPLWLTLETGDDGLAKVTTVSLERPEGGEPQAVYLKSKPVVLYKQYQEQDTFPSVALKFGIERYYVPEGAGLEIEEARNASRTTIAIRVSKDGEAQIARLMIDGETLYEEPFY